MITDRDNQDLSKVFAAEDNESLAAQYEAWAENYDAENAAAGFRLPALGAGLFARYVPISDRPILDAGCGTGLAGDNLAIFGYRNLVGIDLSPGMLSIARKTGIYSRLEQMTLGEQLDFADDSFAGTIATGVFTEGHAPSSSFNELIRVTEPGGYLIFNVRDDIYEEHGFREKQESLEAEGHWRMVERTDRFRPFTVTESHVIARLFAYRIT